MIETVTAATLASLGFLVVSNIVQWVRKVKKSKCMMEMESDAKSR